MIAAIALSLLLATAGGLAAQATPEALTPFQQRRTERMLNDRLACLGCHRLGADGGAIGPALDGLAARSNADYVVRMITNPAATVPGTIMPRQPMPEREARRLAAYLMTFDAAGATTPPGQPEAPPAIAPEQRVDGAALYARHCAACHGTTGDGDGWNAANLPVAPTRHSDAEAMSKRPDDTLYDGIAAGGWVLDRSNRMPAFGELLEPEQIRALVRHIRSLCACEGPGWSRGGGNE